MRRRDFLRAAATSGAFIATRGPLAHALAASSAPADTILPRRRYKDDVRLSVIGFPGFALKDVAQEEADRVVAAAIERGMNYFDVAPTYGNAEEQLGPALERFRKDVFLACKTGKRDRAGADADLRSSLKRLRTDHFDLYQLHHITHVDKDVDVAFGKGGAMEILLDARKAGIIRYLGFSAHSVEAALAAMDRFDFDSALVPINYASWHRGGFGPQIVKAATNKGVRLLALKGMARQKWPEDASRKRYPRCWYEPTSDRREAELSLRFTLGQPIVAAIPPADVSLLPLALDIGSHLKPLTDADRAALQAMGAEWNPVFKT